MKHNVTKKKEIQYYAMIRMGGFVLPMQKSEGVLSEGVLSEGVLSEGVCPEGVLSAHQIKGVAWSQAVRTP